MNLLDLIVASLGGLLCLFTLAQLGFWSAQTWRFNQQSKQQFELARELLRQQVEEAKRQRQNQRVAKIPSGGTETQSPSQTNPMADNQTGKAQTTHSPVSAQGQSTNPVVEAGPEIDSSGNWTGFRKFQVSLIQPETDRCKSICLTPVDDQPIASFCGGQHLPLKFIIPGQLDPVIRCYSVSNGPDQGFYRLTVKAVGAPAANPDAPPGLVSHFINHQICNGDVIEARMPSGSFVADQNATTPMVMLAGGIGITPMISMLEEAFANSTSRLMILLYGATCKQDQAFKKWLDAEAEKRENFHVLHCYSNPGPHDQKGIDFQVQGYVSLDLLKRILPSHNCQFYLCGPPPFMKSLLEGLSEWGVPESQIFSEAFGPASRKSQRTPTIEQTHCSVSFSKTNQTIDWNGQFETLLDLAEEAGVELASGCRAGSCGTCLTRLSRGQVTHDDDVDLGSDECLPCIARPLEDVELDA
ncbi:MAG: 2Fe-2S iron-sulfur cluster-binding protein [Planctomycetota bacterium]